MNIYFIGQKGIPATGGGVESHVEHLSIGLAEKGCNIFVYTRENYTDKNLKIYKNVNLISLPNISTKHLDAISHTFLACLDILKRKDVDIVHFQAIGPSSLMWLIKIFKPKTKIVFTFHCRDYFHAKWGWLAKIYLKIGEFVGCKLADEIIVISKELESYVQEKYKIKANYIPNGVIIPEAINSEELIKKFNLKKDEYIFSASRLVRHKNIHHLIKAFKEINTDKKLVIAGGSAHTEEYVEELRKLAENNDKIIFTGNQSGDTLKELFLNALVFVQPSVSEGLSIALLEAMSYNKIILASDIPANTEALGGKTGLLFKAGSILELKEKLQEILNNIPKFKKNAENGRPRVQEEYCWENIQLKTLKLYKKI